MWQTQAAGTKVQSGSIIQWSFQAVASPVPIRTAPTVTWTARFFAQRILPFQPSAQCYSAAVASQAEPPPHFLNSVENDCHPRKALEIMMIAQCSAVRI